MNPRGAVLVAGGGIAGVQASLDLADSGFHVYLVEGNAAIGGRMSQLDKTFPTNDCSACIISPKLVECGRHLDIDLLTLSEILSIDGEPGNFRVVVRQKPRYVDPSKCIACGACAEKCPKKVDNAFDMGLGKRKAIFLTYPQAVPLKYSIDAEHCIWLNKPGRCGACAKVCPAGAINFEDREQIHEINVGAVILATGFSPFDPSGLDFTGYGRLPNVVTAMEFERLLSPSGPCMGHMERPSDGKEPRRIAWLQCIGSRDINRSCHGYCSSVCCMYAIKQAVIAKEHSESGDLSASIFYMDMRSAGKEFEEYYNRAASEGVRFHRARVHSILPAAKDDNLVLRYADDSGSIQEEEFDLVVLSTGLEINRQAKELAKRLGVELEHDGFIRTGSFSPVSTSKDGIFVCGAAGEPKDIPQSVMEASAAACNAAIMLSGARWTETAKKEYPAERNVFAEPPRIGVFVCSCGINIASVVDVKAVTEYAAKLPGVVFTQNNLFTCSQDTIGQMVETIKREGLNRVVVASCTPRTHEALFQETLRDAGLNKFLFEMANIRDQDSWVHKDDPRAATEKAKDLVRMAVAKVAGDEPLPYNFVPVTKSALVIGAGMAGMTAALALADQGFPVTLIEREQEPGGNARRLYRTWRGDEMAPELNRITENISRHPNIRMLTGVGVSSVTGSVGRFETILTNGETIQHGAAIIATGGEAYVPEGNWRFCY
jgi:heterodisulfide reductase subunit A